jgi:chaperonin GroES
MARNLEFLFEIAELTNVLDKFSKQQTDTLAERMLHGYDVDQDSRKDWVKASEDGFKLVNQVFEEKTYPWVGAANVKYPLITVAAMQFAARAYPQLLSGSVFVKTNIKGPDPQGKLMEISNLIARHMSWQLLEEMEEWEAETDKLLHALPIVGTYFRKTYYDAAGQRNCSHIVSPLKVVVNNAARSLATARRITHEIELCKNDVIERERSGFFVKGIAEKMESTNDQDTEEFLEQHLWFDLDDDGYEEPYIATLHKKTNTVCRVVPRFKEIIPTEDGKQVGQIVPMEYFTKYSFIPNPEGQFYDLGFAHLLGALNHSVNTVFNQMLDAGSLSNLQSGFIAKGARGMGGRMNFQPGEWKPIETIGASLKDSILPLPVRDPSQVLFQLLGLMNDMAMKISSVTDVMTGDSPGQNVPATTTLAMVEQGLKVFTAIYKRIHRAMKEELAKLYDLNSLYLPEYAQQFTQAGQQGSIRREDYKPRMMEIVPATDPNASSQTVALAKANALMQVLQINPTMGGKLESLRQYYVAIGCQPEEIAALLPQQELNQEQPPNPDMIKVQAQITKDKAEIELKHAEMDLKHEKLEAEISLILAQAEATRAQAIKSIADAEAVEVGQQFQEYKTKLDHLKMEMDQDYRNRELEHKGKELEVSRSEAEAPEGEAPEVEEPETPAPAQGSAPQLPELPPSDALNAGEQGGTAAQTLPKLKAEILNNGI